MPVLDSAALVLADGTVFRGRSIGARGSSAGEVVFNTAMTGYQEILTDPSYCRQIVTLTCPHIGNTGVNLEDEEADRVHAAGLVVRDLPPLPSNWRSQGDLRSYLQKHGIVAIADIDTRKLTRILREKGAQNGCLIAGDVNVDKALKEARAFPGLAGMDLAKVVTVDQPYEWSEGRWVLGKESENQFPCRCLRLRHQAQHPAAARRARRARDRRPCFLFLKGSSENAARRRFPLQRAG